MKKIYAAYGSNIHPAVIKKWAPDNKSLLRENSFRLSFMKLQKRMKRAWTNMRDTRMDYMIKLLCP